MDIDLDESLKILEIGFPLSLKKISSAYRNQMKKYHPDINKSKNAQEKCKYINCAKNFLERYVKEKYEESQNEKKENSYKKQEYKEQNYYRKSNQNSKDYKNEYEYEFKLRKKVEAELYDIKKDYNELHTLYNNLKNNYDALQKENKKSIWFYWAGILSLIIIGIFGISWILANMENSIFAIGFLFVIYMIYKDYKTNKTN